MSANIDSKLRSSTLGECKSASNSPQLNRLTPVKKCPEALSPTLYNRHHSIPRVRASSAEPEAVPINPSHSLNVPSSSKTSLFRMKRQPTVDTYSFTKEEFEDYTKVNQYKVLDIIGQGSYGIVRKATDENDAVYAMKILNKKKLMKKGFGGRVRPGMKPRSSPRENIEREIAILKKLDHPNVVRLFEVLDDPQEDDLILVFEYIQKGPVIDELPMAETFSEDKSRKYFIDLILGLEFLHSQHVIHRDIKPQNLLLDNMDRIKIADFGVSEQIEEPEMNTSKWAGTPAFLAPETLSTSTSNSFKGQGVDVWAAGITLCCFIFGKVPWSPPSLPELYDMIQNNDIPFPEDIPISSELQDLLSKLLAKDPERRITLSEVRVHPWILKTMRRIPSVEENCLEEIDVSEEEIRSAIKPFYTPIHILLMIKRMARRRSLRNPKSYSPAASPSTSPTSIRCTQGTFPPPVSTKHEAVAGAVNSSSQDKRNKFGHCTTPSIFIDNDEES